MMLRRAGLGRIVGCGLDGLVRRVLLAVQRLVFQPYNGTVFYAEDPERPVLPASLTKLMTAYVAFQALKAGTVTPDTKLICSKEATEQARATLAESGRTELRSTSRSRSSWMEVGQRHHHHDYRKSPAIRRRSVQRMNETARRQIKQPIPPTSTACPTTAKSPAATLPELARAIIIAFPEHADLFTTVPGSGGQADHAHA